MRTTKLLAVLLALSFVAAACGSNSGSNTASPTTAAPTTAAPTTAAPTTTAAKSEHPDWPKKLVFGFVPSQEQDTLQDDIQPFIKVLSAGLGIDVKGIVTTDYTGLVTAMGTGKADLGAFGPFGYTLGVDQFGNMQALIQSIRFGSATYHGQWMTNNPSAVCNGTPVPATALENTPDGIVQVPALKAVALEVGVYFGDNGKALGETVDAGPVSPGSSCIGDVSKVKGMTVAFTSESSTSGYLFPALELTQLGIDPATDITPIFTGSHDASVTAVYNGDAEIGLSFDDARRTIRKEKPDVGAKDIVFSITPEIPNDVVAVRTDLPQDLKDAIYNTVADYLKTDQGKKIFDSIYGWTSVRRANESDFDIVRKAAQALGISQPPG